MTIINNWQKIAIRRSLGTFDEMYRDTPYVRELPVELAPWHGYLLDAGHCIWSIPGKSVRTFTNSARSLVCDEHHIQAAAYDVNDVMSKNDLEIQEWLIPASVKSVLRGYKIVRGYVVNNLAYDPDIGLLQPDGDDEF